MSTLEMNMRQLPPLQSCELDACTLGGVDDGDDITVAERARAGDEHRLVFAFLEDGPELRFEYDTTLDTARRVDELLRGGRTDRDDEEPDE